MLQGQAQPTQIDLSGGNAAYAVHPPGSIAISASGKIYRYMYATGAFIAADDGVIEAAGTSGYEGGPSTNTAAGEELLGVNVEAVTADQFGWVIVYGMAASVLAFAVTGYTAQLAVVGGVTATGVGNYASGTHTAAGPCGVACETKAAAASGKVLITCF